MIASVAKKWRSVVFSIKERTWDSNSSVKHSSISSQDLGYLPIDGLFSVFMMLSVGHLPLLALISLASEAVTSRLLFAVERKVRGSFAALILRRMACASWPTGRNILSYSNLMENWSIRMEAVTLYTVKVVHVFLERHGWVVPALTWCAPEMGGSKPGLLIGIVKNSSFSDCECEKVNSVSIVKDKNEKGLFNFVFVFQQFNHTAITLLWNTTANNPIWVRYAPSVGFTSSTVVVDTDIMSSWRASKVFFGNTDSRGTFKHIVNETDYVRGHLALAADFLLACERHATFTLVNAVPQPRKHNNKKWKRVEENIRHLFKRKEHKFVEVAPST